MKIVIVILVVVAAFYFFRHMNGAQTLVDGNMPRPWRAE